ncbi:FKBP-type peptidyl-prolyl cis-trans isomerase [Fodinibius salinus]|nr:FKBP-type peptidyl-prolyl cis-trans isomerase [Fodinibius salinus]
MKLTNTSICLLFVSALLLMGCNSNKVSSDAKLSTNIDSVSYSIGYQIGSRSLQKQGMTDVNPALIASGIKAAFEDGNGQLSDSTMQVVMRNYQMKAQRRAQQEKMEKGKEYAKKGEEFLAKNKKKEGVKTTDSGLQYKVLKEGSGVSPDTTDKVKVDYKGTLIDGTTFDSSYERGKPVTFPLNRVIPGWSEGLQQMKEGAKYKLWIPGELGYGLNPPPKSSIAPNQTLIFEVELLEVNPEGSGSSN